MNKFNNEAIDKFEDKFWDSISKIEIRLSDKLIESISIEFELRGFYSEISIQYHKQLKTIEL